MLWKDITARQYNMPLLYSWHLKGEKYSYKLIRWQNESGEKYLYPLLEWVEFNI